MHSLLNFKYRYKMRLKLYSSLSCVIYLPILIIVALAIGQVRPIQDNVFTSSNNQQATNNKQQQQQQQQQLKSQCKGRIFRPLGCELNHNCSYQLAWHYNSTTDNITFSVTLDSTEKWAAVGFAQERSLKNVDAIFGWTENNTNFVMMDGYLPTWLEPVSDKNQSIANVRVKRVSRQGTEYKFERRRNTNDPESDVVFSDENCPYLVLPYQGGLVDRRRRQVFTSAEQLPDISPERVCIRSCNYVPPLPPSTTTTSTSTSTTPSPASPAAEAAEPAVSSSTRAPNQRPTRPQFKPPRTTTTTTTTTTQQPSSTTTTTTSTTTTSAPEPPTTTTTSTTTTTTPAPTTTATPAPPTTTTTTQKPSSSTTTTTTTVAPPSSTTTTTTTLKPKVQTQFVAEESAPPGSNSVGGEQQWCVGRWSHPPNCRFQAPVANDLSSYLQQPIDSSVNIRPLPLELSDCTYYAQWQYLEASDSVEFIIQTKTRNRWTGIGFSNSTRMANSDAIIGLIEELSGRHFVMDTWLKDHVMPEIDQNQNTEQTSGKRENGTTTVRFRRKRLTDDQYDFQFTDSSCAYFFFPTQGGPFNAISKRLHKHEMVPFVSKQRICIKKCLAPPKLPQIVTTPTTTTTATSSTSAKPNLFLITSSSSNNPVLTQFNNQPAPGDLAPQPPEKSLDGQSNNHLSPSNDLSAELDSASVTSSVFAPTSGSGPSGPGNASNLLEAGAGATAGRDGGANGLFNKLAFLAEPSLRWLAAIGCVATILAVIVFQACFTVYKNKQAYKQNLYRQSAFKQNNYLQGAYLTPDTHNLGAGGVGHHHVEVEDEEEDEVEPEEEDVDMEGDDVDEEEVDEVDEEELDEEEEELDDEDEEFDDYAHHHHHPHPQQQPQHRHHLPRPTVSYPHHRAATAAASNHLPGYYPPQPKHHHHHHNNPAYYPQQHPKQPQQHHHHRSNTASPHRHHQMMHQPQPTYHPQQQQRAPQQHYRSAGGHHHHGPPPAAAMQHQMHAAGNHLHHSNHRISASPHHHNVAGPQQHNLRSPDSYFLPSQRRYNKQ